MNIQPIDQPIDVLATLVEAYEAKPTPIEPPEPISALEHDLDRQGLERKDLVPYIGTIGRVHEIMNRRWQTPVTDWLRAGVVATACANILPKRSPSG